MSATPTPDHPRFAPVVDCGPPGEFGDRVPAYASLPVTLDPAVTDQLVTVRPTRCNQPGAMVHAPAVAARVIWVDGHGPGARAMARHIRPKLEAVGITLTPILPG